MTSIHNVVSPAFKRLLRATGVNPGNAFFLSHDSHNSPNNYLTDKDIWCNYAVSSHDTVATCEIETKDYFGPNSSAFICVKVRPARPGVSFPTSCVISLSTSSQRIDELSIQDVIVKEWVMHPKDFLNSTWMETTIAVKTIYHIACLIGKEPITGTRIFLTLRFVGCCDMSDTHRIAAVNISYTLLHQVIPPVSMMTSKNILFPNNINNIKKNKRTVEVELTLSPTPIHTTEQDYEEEENSSDPRLQLISHTQSPIEKTIILDNEISPREIFFSTSSRNSPIIEQNHIFNINNDSISQVEDNNNNNNNNNSNSSGEDFILAEYSNVDKTPSSPRYRSVTQPRRTIFVDAMKEEYSDNIVEIQTSPCTTHSNSSFLNNIPPKLEEVKITKSLTNSSSSSSSSSTISSKLLNSLNYIEDNRSKREDSVPRREVPMTPKSFKSENSFFINSLQKHCYEKSIQKFYDVENQQKKKQPVPLIYQTPSIVPDRRNFIPISFLQQQKQQQEEGMYMHLNEVDNFSKYKPNSFNTEGTAFVEEKKKRIRNLRDIPVYEEKYDLLKVATELLGVERESLCKRSTSQTSSIATNSYLFSTETNMNSKRQSSLSCTNKEIKENKKHNISSVEEVKDPNLVEVEPITSIIVNEDTSNKENNLHNSEFIHANSPILEYNNEDLHIVLNKLETVKKPKEENFKIPHKPKPVENPRFINPVKFSNTKREPLSDRTLDLNLNCKDKKITVNSNELEKQQSKLENKIISCDTSIPSSDMSDELSLDVQVEQLNLNESSTYWGNNISIVPENKLTDSIINSPFIGTFLVWKHHMSRKGTAKRILSLQRKDNSILVSLKKLDRNSSKASEIILRDKIEVITGLRAYYSNAIHTNNVHIAECCLVLTCNGKQITAVEMQSENELHLAIKILLPICN